MENFHFSSLSAKNVAINDDYIGYDYVEKLNLLQEIESFKKEIYLIYTFLYILFVIIEKLFLGFDDL